MINNLGIDGDTALFGGVGTDGRRFTVYVQKAKPGRPGLFKIAIEPATQFVGGPITAGEVQLTGGSP